MTEDTVGSVSARTKVAVWFVDVREAGTALRAWDDQAQAVDAATKDRLGRIKSYDDRETRLAVHRALRVLVERHAGRSWRGVPLQYAPDGRPDLAGSGLSFSISHTARAGLIALSQGKRVGVDLEARGRAMRMSKWRQDAIVSAALQLPLSCDARTKESVSFLDAWVRMEAYAKASGIGLGTILKQALAHPEAAQRSPGQAGPQSTFTTTADQDLSQPSDGNALLVYDLSVDNAYAAALAIEGGNVAPGISRFPSSRAAIDALCTG